MTQFLTKPRGITTQILTKPRGIRTRSEWKTNYRFIYLKFNELGLKVSCLLLLSYLIRISDAVACS